MPYLRHSSPADNPAACSFSTLMICSSVNLLLRMSVSLGNGLYPKTGAFKGSRSVPTASTLCHHGRDRSRAKTRAHSVKLQPCGDDRIVGTRPRYRPLFEQMDQD